jgi:cell division protein FtsQ
MGWAAAMETGRSARVSRSSGSSGAGFNAAAQAETPLWAQLWAVRRQWLWLLWLSLAVALVAALALWALRTPALAIQGIQFKGDIQRVNTSTALAYLQPRLKGNFLSTDLAHARTVLESVPWVRRAVVQRAWPRSLVVSLQEHQVAARWLADDGGERLVNVQGEVFDASLSEVDQPEGLPLLGGPDGSAAQMLALYKGLAPVFAKLDLRIEELALSGRGSWSARLNDEIDIEMGRGTPAEVLARTQRFAATVSQVTGGFKAPWLSADLRHNGGYALRLKGLSAIDTPTPPGRP